MKKVIIITLVLCMLTCTSYAAYINDTEPLASNTFISASTTLNADKSVTFYCKLKLSVPSIYISYCWLQQKIDGNWEFVCQLTPPSDVGSGVSFVTSKSYSSVIGSGTYRVAANYNANGEIKCAYSGERTF